MKSCHKGVVDASLYRTWVVKLLTSETHWSGYQVLYCHATYTFVYMNSTKFYFQKYTMALENMGTF